MSVGEHEVGGISCLTCGEFIWIGLAIDGTLPPPLKIALLFEGAMGDIVGGVAIPGIVGITLPVDNIFCCSMNNLCNAA